MQITVTDFVLILIINSSYAKDIDLTKETAAIS